MQGNDRVAECAHITRHSVEEMHQPEFHRGTRHKRDYISIYVPSEAAQKRMFMAGIANTAYYMASYYAENLQLTVISCFVTILAELPIVLILTDRSCKSVSFRTKLIILVSGTMSFATNSAIIALDYLCIYSNPILGLGRKDIFSVIIIAAQIAAVTVEAIIYSACFELKPINTLFITILANIFSLYQSILGYALSDWINGLDTGLSEARIPLFILTAAYIILLVRERDRQRNNIDYGGIEK